MADLFDWVKKLRGKRHDNGQEGVETFEQPTPAVSADAEDSDVVTTVSENETAHQSLVNQFFTSFTTDSTSRTDLINGYRDLEEIQEVDFAVQEIVDQAIVPDELGDAVWPDFSQSNISENIQKKMTESWDKVMKLTYFHEKGQSFFRRWYVDSRIHFYVSVNKDKTTINNIYRLDPRFVEKRKEYITKDNQIVQGRRTQVYTGVREYYVYTPREKEIGALQAMGMTMEGKKFVIPKESIVSAYSGLTDPNGYTISYLHRAIRPVNQLKMLEDAVVVYRIARAPERLAIYVDTGGMGTKASKKYIKEMQEAFKRKTVYDPKTGKSSSKYDVTSIGENYWLPRKNGRSTEIQSIQGGQNLGEMDDVEYFNRKVWDSLRLPKSRLEVGNTFGGGREMEISRDELRFDKLINRLRNEFKTWLMELYRIVIVLDGVMTPEEFDEERQNIKIVFANDSFFEESKDLELLSSKLLILRDIDEYVGEGKYYSRQWVRKNVLNQGDEEIDAIKKENEDEPVVDEEPEDSGNNFFR